MVIKNTMNTESKNFCDITLDNKEEENANTPLTQLLQQMAFLFTENKASKNNSHANLTNSEQKPEESKLNPDEKIKNDQESSSILSDLRKELASPKSETGSIMRRKLLEKIKQFDTPSSLLAVFPSLCIFNSQDHNEEYSTEKNKQTFENLLTSQFMWNLFSSKPSKFSRTRSETGGIYLSHNVINPTFNSFKFLHGSSKYGYLMSMESPEITPDHETFFKKITHTHFQLRFLLQLDRLIFSIWDTLGKIWFNLFTRSFFNNEKKGMKSFFPIITSSMLVTDYKSFIDENKKDIKELQELIQKSILNDEKITKDLTSTINELKQNVIREIEAAKNMVDKLFESSHRKELKTFLDSIKKECVPLWTDLTNFSNFTYLILPSIASYQAKDLMDLAYEAQIKTIFEEDSKNNDTNGWENVSFFKEYYKKGNISNIGSKTKQNRENPTAIEHFFGILITESFLDYVNLIEPKTINKSIYDEKSNFEQWKKIEGWFTKQKLSKWGYGLGSCEFSWPFFMSPQNSNTKCFETIDFLKSKICLLRKQAEYKNHFIQLNHDKGKKDLILLEYTIPLNLNPKDGIILKPEDITIKKKDNEKKTKKKLSEHPNYPTFSGYCPKTITTIPINPAINGDIPFKQIVCCPDEKTFVVYSMEEFSIFLSREDLINANNITSVNYDPSGLKINNRNQSPSNTISVTIPEALRLQFVVIKNNFIICVFKLYALSKEVKNDIFQKYGLNFSFFPDHFINVIGIYEIKKRDSTFAFDYLSCPILEEFPGTYLASSDITELFVSQEKVPNHQKWKTEFNFPDVYFYIGRSGKIVEEYKISQLLPTNTTESMSLDTWNLSRRIACFFQMPKSWPRIPYDLIKCYGSIIVAINFEKETVFLTRLRPRLKGEIENTLKGLSKEEKQRVYGTIVLNLPDIPHVGPPKSESDKQPIKEKPKIVDFDMMGTILAVGLLDGRIIIFDTSSLLLLKQRKQNTNAENKEEGSRSFILTNKLNISDPQTYFGTFYNKMTTLRFTSPNILEFYTKYGDSLTAAVYFPSEGQTIKEKNEM